MPSQAPDNRRNDIPIYGTQTRPFCYVDDLINGLVSLMATPDDVISPVNPGNPKRSSLPRILEAGSWAEASAVSWANFDIQRDSQSVYAGMNAAAATGDMSKLFSLRERLGESPHGGVIFAGTRLDEVRTKALQGGELQDGN